MTGLGHPAPFGGQANRGDRDDGYGGKVGVSEPD